MRRPLFLSLILLTAPLRAHDFSGPQGSVQLDWQSERIARVTASGYGDSFGMEAMVLRGLPDTVEVDGKRCMEGSYFIVDVNDEYAFDIDETVELTVLLHKGDTTAITVGYDRNGKAETLFDVPLEEAEGEFLQQTITLERARFANRGEAGSDLFVAGASVYFPGNPDHNHRIVLCDVTVNRPNPVAEKRGTGALALRVLDDDGKPLPARIGIYDATGRSPLPSDDALEIPFYDDRKTQIFMRETHPKVSPWPHANRYISYTDGEYSADLPKGQYDIVVARGPEFRVHQQEFSVAAGKETSLNIELEQFMNLPAHGWYSGDDHVHMPRSAADNEAIATLMRAEGIHVTNILQMGNPTSPYFLQYAFGDEGRYFVGHYGLVPGIEDPRTAVRGHTISLNIQEPIRDVDAYLRYDRTFRLYHEQGAMSGYAHVAGNWFNAGRGLALDVPLGNVDFVEVLQDGELGTELWYDFLNLGFALVPTAGSDFPYLNHPGAERNYVYTGDSFSPDRWFEQLAEGHTYVTNGPFLEFMVDGQNMGQTIEAQVGDRLPVQAIAHLNPDLEALHRIELVVNGTVVKTIDAQGKQDAELNTTLDVDGGFWVAVRAYGQKETVAHSAPVFVVTDERGFRNDELAPEIIGRMKSRIAEFETLEVVIEEELETWEVRHDLERMLPAQRSAILNAVDQAIDVYDAILEDIATWQ